MRRGSAVVAGFIVAMFPSIAGAADGRACLVLEGQRVLERGGALDTCRSQLSLTALREEHVAFQVVVEAGDAPLEEVRVTLEGAPTAFEMYVEHFVDVTARSRTNEGPESLAFTAGARPPDEGMLGAIPDALIPVDIAPAWAPYPMSIRPSERGIVYVEAFVPKDAEAGSSTIDVKVEAGGAAHSSLTVQLHILEPRLPYNVLSAFTFYERASLEGRFEDAAKVEREVARILHEHHLETMVEVVSEADADKIGGALSGSWFTEASGYRGPGAGVPSSLFVIGSYGSLGPPDKAMMPVIDALAWRAPETVEDLFVYAVDETCDSPFGPAWRALLDDAGLHGRVEVGHTCHEDPEGQGVDVIMIPAQAFRPKAASRARSHGKSVWIYNGQLPHASPMMLDVPLTGLTANGWIGAAFDVGRWFYWESIFWNDGNRGGKGPRDVFASAETFHNADGDTSLYDGLLLYPQRQPDFPEHDLGRDGVLPSLRLKALRRGLEDAALLSLAAQADAPATASVARSIVGAALDEVEAESPVAFETDPEAHHEARLRLREIIGGSTTRSDRGSVVRGLSTLREERSRERSAVARGLVRGETFGLFFLGGLFGALVALGGGIAFVTRPRAPRATRPG